MSYAMNDMNQFDATKADENAFEASALNATHELILLEEQIVSLCQQVQAMITPVVDLDSTKVDYKALEALNNDFDELVYETNVLNELFKKLNAIKVIPIPVRYENSKQKVPLILSSPNSSKALKKEHKRFFYEFEEALDNTDIIDTVPHEATLFKVAVLYKLFLDQQFFPRVIKMSIAIRKDDLPDHFKYIKEKPGIRREADYIELGEQAYQEITNSNDKNLKQRFEASYEKFKEIYLGLIRSKDDSTGFQDNDIELSLPEVPKNSPLDGITDYEGQQKTNVERLPSTQSNRDYVKFSGDEFTTLQFLVPDHQKKIFIPSIGGIALDKFMRSCLSKQIGIKETKDVELRKRIAAEQFILKASDILNNASSAMRNDKIGKLFDPPDGFVSYHADPDIIFKEIKNLYENYQKKLIIIPDCKLSGPELIEAFFSKLFNRLEQNLTHNIKKQETFKTKYKDKPEHTTETLPQCIIEMKNFKKLVEEIGPENINIFPGEEGKMCLSVPKKKIDLSVIDQSEDKADKIAFKTSELSDQHPLAPLEQPIASSTQQVQTRISPVVDLVSKVDPKTNEEVDNKFPKLITDTKVLIQQVKKLSMDKVITIPVRYKNSKKKVPLKFFSNLRKASCKKHKRFFYEFEKALDNTDIIDAFPDEAILLKVAALYLFFLDQYPSRAIKMSIATRKPYLPDRFKYIKKQDIRVKADYIELGKQAYQEITNSNDKKLKQRFDASYEKFKEIYLGLIRSKDDSTGFQDNDIELSLPEVPKNSALDGITDDEAQQKTNAERLPSTQSNRNYVMLRGDELTTLQFLIPTHQKNIFIPSIGGIALDKFMRNCLSKRITIKETKDTELRKRTAAEQFILEAIDILNKVLNAMKNNKLGEIPQQGARYEADADNFFNEIKKVYENYQKKQIIIQDCKLSGSELTEAFFNKAIDMLKQSLVNELETLNQEYLNKKKPMWNFFKARNLKSKYENIRKQTKETYRLRINEMENFKKLVEETGPEKINIFAGEKGKMCLSVPKDTFINDDGIARAGFSAIASR